MYKHESKSIYVTGIKSAENFLKVIEFVKRKFQVKIEQMRIDNSMFSCKKKVAIDRNKLLLEINNKNFPYSTNFTMEVFPAIFLKPRRELKKRGAPTIIFFPSTGSYVLLGGKRLIEIKHASVYIENLIKKYSF